MEKTKPTNKNTPASTHEVKGAREAPLGDLPRLRARRRVTPQRHDVADAVLLVVVRNAENKYPGGRQGSCGSERRKRRKGADTFWSFRDRESRKNKHDTTDVFASVRIPVTGCCVAVDGCRRVVGASSPTGRVAVAGVELGLVDAPMGGRVECARRGHRSWPVLHATSKKE